MAAQMLKFYHCGIFYGVQERFRPMSVGIIMPEGLHNTEKNIYEVLHAWRTTHSGTGGNGSQGVL